MARRRYIKNGDPKLSTYFNDETYSRMSRSQKAQWSPADFVPKVPIQPEVIDFMSPSSKGQIPKEVIDSTEDERKVLLTKLKEMGIKTSFNAKLSTLKKRYEDAIASK
jgi:hypothetical protein